MPVTRTRLFVAVVMTLVISRQLPPPAPHTQGIVVLPRYTWIEELQLSSSALLAVERETCHSPLGMSADALDLSERPVSSNNSILWSYSVSSTFFRDKLGNVGACGNDKGGVFLFFVFESWGFAR